MQTAMATERSERRATDGFDPDELAPARTEGFARGRADGAGPAGTDGFSPDGAEHFLSGFDALAQAVRRARGANARAPDAGLTLSQYALLEGLIGRPVARVQELAAHAAITASTATRILDALERRGIVERTRSDEDRRAVAVSLTPTGEQLLEAEREWLRGRQRRFYASLPPAERALAPVLLLRLAALIDEIAAGPAD
jgi:DNA-binding MarR family transcriptional regulator